MLKVCKCHPSHGSWMHQGMAQGHDPREGWLQMDRDGAANAPAGAPRTQAQDPPPVVVSFSLTSIRTLTLYPMLREIRRKDAQDKTLGAQDRATHHKTALAAQGPAQGRNVGPTSAA